MKLLGEFVSKKTERISTESKQSRSGTETNSDCPPTMRRVDGIPGRNAVIIIIFLHEYNYKACGSSLLDVGEGNTLTSNPNGEVVKEYGVYRRLCDDLTVDLGLTVHHEGLDVGDDGRNGCGRNTDVGVPDSWFAKVNRDRGPVGGLEEPVKVTSAVEMVV